MKRAIAGQSEGEAEINISPLIDMVFILLIFFIVTTVFVEESGLGLDTPDPEQIRPPEPAEPFVLTVGEGGSVYYDGREIGLMGVLGSIQDARAMGALDSVTIEVHRRASMLSATRVLDLCTAAKVAKVVMKSLPESD